MRTSILSILAVMLLVAIFTVAVPPASGEDRAVPVERWLGSETHQETADAIKARRIIYDPVRDLLYASVPALDAGQGSVVVFHRDGRTSPLLVVGEDPNVLALSADGQFLYVGLDGLGAVRRIDLDTLRAEPPWLLGNNMSCPIFVATDMVVLANDPHSVAVARHNPCQREHVGVAVFEDGHMLPDTTSAFLNNDVIEPSLDSAFLSGLDRDSDEQVLRRLSVDSMGVNEVLAVPNLLSSYAYDMLFDSGRLYMTSGDVVSSSDLAYRGKFEVTNNSLPVVRDGRAFFLVYDPWPRHFELQVFDAGSFNLLATTTIAGLVDSQPGEPVDFIDTGRGSMGIRLGDGSVYWLNVQLIQYSSFLPAIMLSAANHAQ